MSVLRYLPLKRLDKEEDPFEPLPVHSSTHRPLFNIRLRQLSRLCPLLLALLLLLPTALYILFYRQRLAQVTSTAEDSRVVGSIYAEFYEHEQHLPQHDESLPFPEGRDGRYLWVSTQHWGLGWNNVFQAYCLLTQMAFMSNRAFVFRPYVWRMDDKAAVTEYYGEKRANQIPLSAILGGPLGGGNLPRQFHEPRSVTIDWFHHICPPNRTTVFFVKDLNQNLDDNAANVMERYVDALKSSEAGCVELRSDGLTHPFDFGHFGSDKLINIWPVLAQSPFFTEFAWSPLVLSALPTNVAKLSYSFLENPMPPSAPGLLTVHIRRGDYEEHCRSLSQWSSRYMGWNSFPSLPDKFSPPPKGADGEPTAEYNATYTRHCYPDIHQIMNRIFEVRNEWKVQTEERLTHLYIMTNAEEIWLRELVQLLHSTKQWSKISSVQDFTLTVEQEYVSQIIDMAIGERGSVFLGNGFSSFTANIVFLRSLRKLPMSSNRFW